MEIKLFSLMKGETAAYAGSKKIISDCVNSFSSSEEKFKNFSSPKRMLLAVSQSLRSADAAVIAIQSSAYNSIKKMICDAFKLECVSNETIYTSLLPLYEKKKITKSVLENNSAFPKKADIFAVSDFKCCGFSVTSGAQSIIVLPLDEIKTGEVVFGSLYDFLSDISGAGSREDVSKLKRARLAARLVSLLKKNQSRLAFSKLGGAQLIEESINIVDKNRSTLFIAAKPEPRQNTESVEDYIVSVAQKTRSESKTDFACAISSAFASNTDDSTFIYYAVADKEETFVSKLYAKKDESSKQLYRAAVESALLACANRVSINNAAKKDENRKGDKLLRQKIAFIAAGAVAAATGISAILALILS